MKFQPGQSGNPAGRPLGARNKKTIAMQAVFVATQDETAKLIVARAQCGHPTAMRICAERTPPALELPPVRCAADAQKALDMVIEAFGRGEITVRELPTMLGSVDRMARVAQRIETMRGEEHERYAKQRVHGVHPDMIPKPTGEPDRLELLNAAIERGEDPFPDDPVKSAYVLGGEDLYSPVNSNAEASSLPRAAGEGGSPEHREGEPGGGTVVCSEPAWPELDSDVLYSPVNFAEHGVDRERPQAVAAVCAEESPSETLAPSLPRVAGEGGDPGPDPGEPGGGVSQSRDSEMPDRAERDGLYSSVNSDDESAGASPPPGAADAAPPSPCGGGMHLNPG